MFVLRFCSLFLGFTGVPKSCGSSKAKVVQLIKDSIPWCITAAKNMGFVGSFKKEILVAFGSLLK